MSKQLIFLSAAALSLFLTTFTLHAQAPVADSPAIEQRVDVMLSKLTLEQKLDLISGENDMFIKAQPAAGFPRLKMSDGPVGVRTWGPDTAYAGGIGLAATWDPALAERMGVSMAHDARARGVHFLLGPGTNIYRAPMNGRNFEYFGEDPYLAAHTVVPYIEGVQSQGVIATVKHFVANNEEYDRHNVSSDIDERTLREIYLPSFEAAVRVAHTGSVMNSYNLLNGIHATQNSHLNNDILKKDWGFDGILMSDWDATYDAVEAAKGGLDLEMPSGKFMNAKNLIPAIRSGQVSEAVIDDKVRRIFRTAIRFGFLDREQTDLSIPQYSPMGREVALDEAREGAVLLKNENNLLPLDAEKVHTLAVIGPDAWPAVATGGGSGEVSTFAPVSIMTGLSQYLGKRVKVVYARGLPETQDIFDGTQFVEPGGAKSPSQESKAVKVEIFQNETFTGTPTILYSSHIASFKSEAWAPSAGTRKSVRFTAEYLPAKTGNYLLLISAVGSDDYKVIVDGKQVLGQRNREGQAPQFFEVPFTANQRVKIQVDYLPDASYSSIGLGLKAVDELVTPETAKLAAAADAAVVAVGFNPTLESEGFDRSYTLPWGEDQLIQAVTAANKKTVVTITAGGGVDTRRWLNDVPALLHNWYPGQEGGTAIAEILFGARSPEGHLPISLERSWEENPVHDNYYAPPVRKGETPHVKYAEGVFLGYRYYTTMNKEPLFPFGFGLSYTTFAFSGLSVSPESASADGPITVSFDVENTGQRAGATVAQLYIGDPSAKIKRPVKELKGYQKVRLDPGGKQHITLTLDRRSLAYWDVASNNWRVDPGQFTVFVGDSSANTPLTRDFTIQ